MAFLVQDFQDLLRLLDEHPEWRDELRRRVLSDDILRLPALIREQGQYLAAAAARLEELSRMMAGALVRIDHLESDVGVLKQDVAVLKEDVGVLKEDVAVLKQDVGVLKQDVGVLKQDVATLKVDVADLKGSDLEARYRDRAPSYFGRHLRRIRVLSQTALADLLDDAVEEGLLVSAEREAVLNADLVLRGRRIGDQTEAYLLAEVSAVIDRHDVERAADRAHALGKLGTPVLAAVAGHSVTDEAQSVARRLGVHCLLDGTAAE